MSVRLPWFTCLLGILFASSSVAQSLPASAPSVAPVCGDGATNQATEQCDTIDLQQQSCESLSGGLLSGDLSCTVDCRFDESSCVEACGDGRLAKDEQCDDGNKTTGDGCNASCGIEVCGNGRLDAGEVCDDGNTTAGDGCRADCFGAEQCGDGLLDTTEECEPDMQGCSASCTRPFRGFLLSARGPNQGIGVVGARVGLGPINDGRDVATIIDVSLKQSIGESISLQVSTGGMAAGFGSFLHLSTVVEVAPVARERASAFAFRGGATLIVTFGVIPAAVAGAKYSIGGDRLQLSMGVDMVVFEDNFFLPDVALEYRISKRLGVSAEILAPIIRGRIQTEVLGVGLFF